MRFFRRRIAEVVRELDEETERQTEQNLTDMASVAATLSGLQDELAVANTPPKNQFKPVWLLAAVVVFLIIGGGTFMAFQRLTDVDANTKAIAESCQIRNDALLAINQKFMELNVLIEASVSTADTTNPKYQNFLAAFETLRKPIPLKPC